MEKFSPSFVILRSLVSMRSSCVVLVDVKFDFVGLRFLMCSYFLASLFSVIIFKFTSLFIVLFVFPTFGATRWRFS